MVSIDYVLNLLQVKSMFFSISINDKVLHIIPLQTLKFMKLWTFTFNLYVEWIYPLSIFCQLLEKLQNTNNPFNKTIYSLNAGRKTSATTTCNFLDLKKLN